MKRRLLLILAAVVRPGDEHFRLIKYSQFPPLSLMTIAGLTPDDWDITVRDEHVESSEVDGDVDLVGIQTYISSAGRAYELARRWQRRGARLCSADCIRRACPTRPPNTPTPCASVRPRRSGARFSTTSSMGSSRSSIEGAAKARRPWCRSRGAT